MGQVLSLAASVSLCRPQHAQVWNTNAQPAAPASRRPPGQLHSTRPPPPSRRLARPGFLLPLPSAAARCLWAAPHPRLTQEHHTQQAAPAPRAAAAAAAAPDDAGAPPSAAAAAAPTKPRQLFSYCRMCGGPMELALPEGDGQWRHVCQRCRCGPSNCRQGKGCSGISRAGHFPGRRLPILSATPP